MRLLITDLDNTLYDWITFFSSSFTAMLDELSSLLDTSPQQLTQEFKAIHQRYHNTEQPFAALELPSVEARFPNTSFEERLLLLERPLEAFREKRTETLQLYPSVYATLQKLHEKGVLIVGHTEAMVYNAYTRISLLELEPFFHHLYTFEGSIAEHPHPESSGFARLPKRDFISQVPRSEKKPNPALLHDICAKEGVAIEDAVYVGDSITRDIFMANQAGVTSVWAQYGKQFETQHWDTLVGITHWSPEDVQREAQLQHLAQETKPNHIIQMYEELLHLF